MWHMPHVRISSADASHISKNSWGRLGKALSGSTLMEECNGSWPKSVFFFSAILGVLSGFCKNTWYYLVLLSLVFQKNCLAPITVPDMMLDPHN